MLPTAAAGLEETPSLTALILLDLDSKGLPLATTLTPRLGLGLDWLSGPCLPLAVPCVLLKDEDTRVVVEDDPRARAEGVVNGLTVVEPSKPADLCELPASGKL